MKIEVSVSKLFFLLLKRRSKEDLTHLKTGIGGRNKTHRFECE